MFLALSSRCLTQAPKSLFLPFNVCSRMVPERRSKRAAARAHPHASSASEEKQFSTPCKPSTITKAEIKRASVIFSDLEEDSCIESSENSSQDCATEKFSRRRVDPQLDTIRRKLNFNQKSFSRNQNETGFKSVASTFRARKVRATEQKSMLIDKMLKLEPVDEAERCGHFEVESGAETASRGETKYGERQRRKLRGNGYKVKLESVDSSVKQETQVEANEVEPRGPRRRKASVKTKVKSEDEFMKLVEEKPEARVRLGKRKLDLAVGMSTEKDPEKSKKHSGDLDQFAHKGSTALVLADATNVTPPATLGALTLDETPSSVGVKLPYNGPYPSHARPHPEECEAVRDLLSDLHGHLPEYERHKVSCPTIRPSILLLQNREDHRDESDASGSTEIFAPELAAVMMEKVQDEIAVADGHPRERSTVLDSLVGTLLSQNTTDNNSRKAFASLKRKYPTWEDVHYADPKVVEETIRCGGLAEIKTRRILEILKTLVEERGKICMEYMRSMSNEEIKKELSRFKGVGPKTVACVLMFHLQRNEFPVDTHVFRISKALGWVPAAADREKAYLHLNQRIPDHLKFDIHCLFVTHGKRCPNCAKRQTKKKGANCPLVNWSSKVLRPKSSVLLLKGSEVA